MNKDQLQELYVNQKLSIDKIRDISKISKKTIKKLISLYGLQKEEPLNKDLLQELYINQKLHPRDIAKLYNTSRDKVIRLLNKHHIEKDNITKKLEAIEKTKKTNIERYGVDSPLKNKIILDNTKKTNIERYGTSCTLNNPLIDRKRQSTYINHYGTHPKKAHITHLEHLNKDFILEHFVDNNQLLFDQLIDYFNISGVKGRRLKHEFNLEHLPNKPTRNTYEVEVFNFIKNYETNTTMNNRTLIYPRELDVLVPNKLAIEFDGLMYHSFGPHNRNRFNNVEDEYLEKYNHLNKTKSCEEQNIQLFHIFENEWKYQKEIWKSVLLNKLGKSERIYARKCKIKEVSKRDTREFLNLNHLQGKCNCRISIGLYYEDELISVMTFGKSRFNKNYEWELLRFCNKINISVVGGASRLLKYFIRNYNPKNIISYANRRWSQGGLYRSLGFKYLGETKPNYFYFHIKNKDTLYSRNKFQKYKLRNLLYEYNPKLTETQNMYNNGYRKIYDCGNLVYELSFNKV